MITDFISNSIMMFQIQRQRCRTIPGKYFILKIPAATAGSVFTQDSASSFDFVLKINIPR